MDETTSGPTGTTGTNSGFGAAVISGASAFNRPAHSSSAAWRCMRAGISSENSSIRSSGMGLVRGLHISLGEVGALEQQRLATGFGERIGEAVAQVEALTL